MRAADPDDIAIAVGDDADRPVGREVVGAFEQVHPGLEHGSAAASDLDPTRDLVDDQIARVVGRRIARRSTYCDL